MKKSMIVILAINLAIALFSQSVKGKTYEDEKWNGFNGQTTTRSYQILKFEEKTVSYKYGVDSPECKHIDEEAIVYEYELKTIDGFSYIIINKTRK